MIPRPVPQPFFTIFFVTVAALAVAAAAHAEVRCPPVFGDYMVLQRDQVVPVWGDAAPGETVTVEFETQRKSITADANGHWHIELDRLTATAEGQTLTIRGSDRRLTFTDVLVGEVWFCSGQSNMEKPLGLRKGQKPTTDYETELARSTSPTLRLFQVPHSGKAAPDSSLMRWLPCNAQALTDSNFSAAAYYFGRELTRELGVPVGLIHSSYGGTRIETWMPHEAFASDPVLRALETERYTAPKGTQATELYATMVAPYVPFGVRGFLWYQGETNCMNAEDGIYSAKMRALIAAWRNAWHEENAAFYYTLIAPFTYSTFKGLPKHLTLEALPVFWQAQIAALSVPHTGIVTTTDIAGTARDIHPTDKRDVGLRYARLALQDTYGRRDIQAHVPLFAAMHRHWWSRRIELEFSDGRALHSRDGQPLNEFTIAGADRKFVPAIARVKPNGRVEVWSGDVSKPVAVRFGWHDTANPNLVNAAALPALPFRTDDWPVVIESERDEAPKR